MNQSCFLIGYSSGQGGPVADQGEGPGGSAPLILDQTEAQKAVKNFVRVIKLVIKQIGLPLRVRPILLITRLITDRIGLHSVLLPLLIALIPSRSIRQLMANFSEDEF